MRPTAIALALLLGSALPCQAAEPPAGRLLASQCFQCHGTNGISVSGIEGLAGESENEIIEEMREMRGETANDIMTAQAHGFTDAEVRLIAQYLATLPKGSSAGGSDHEGD